MGRVICLSSRRVRRTTSSQGVGRGPNKEKINVDVPPDSRLTPLFWDELFGVPVLHVERRSRKYLRGPHSCRLRFRDENVSSDGSDEDLAYNVDRRDFTWLLRFDLSDLGSVTLRITLITAPTTDGENFSDETHKRDEIILGGLWKCKRSPPLSSNLYNKPTISGLPFW